ncbi:MAG: hypothetical protein PHV34_23495 [Verrucomicrobiae bacterium]|nr:hypothetical protein [Verrucomicrobiae bacterium]
MNDLQILFLGLGMLCLAVALWAWSSPGTVLRFLQELPRNQALGKFLMLVNTVWALWLFHLMRLGDWDIYKQIILYAGPLIYWFIITHVTNYLGARSAGLLLILAAKPLLKICFLHDEPLRLVIVIIAYLWVLAGITLVAAPHWLRDFANFLGSKPKLWRWNCQLKAASGITLIILAFLA